MNALVPVRNEKVIEDGAFIKALDFCKHNCSSDMCQKFYNGISSKNYNRFIVCPHGMSVYVAQKGDRMHYFVCMRNKDAYDSQKAKSIYKASKNVVYNPTLDTDKLLELINYSILHDDEEMHLKEQRASIESISHEAKKLNAQIKDRADIILQTYELDSEQPLSVREKQSLAEKIKTIYVSSSVIQGRFTLLDYEKDPMVLKSGLMFDCNVYKKFQKMQKIFSNFLGRKVPIRITGNSFECFRAYPSFEMIPLLIIDNAVKYSYDNNPVEITFDNGNKELFVEVNSFGPVCSQTEIAQIFQKGFRGKNAIKTSDGSGIGLFFVKMLCDIHGIDISISSGTPTATINDIAYAPFIVRLHFKDTYQIRGG